MPSLPRIALSSIAVAAAWGMQTAAAREVCKTVSPDCVVVGDWGLSVSLGAGTRTNPIVGKSDIPLYVIPEVSYYGKHVFLEGLEPGVTLYEGETHTFNLIASPGYDSAFFHRYDLQNVFVASVGRGTGGGAEGTSGNVPPGGGAGNTPPPPLNVDIGRHATYLAGPEWLFAYGGFNGQIDALYEVTGRHRGYEVRAAASMPLVRSEKDSLGVNVGGTWQSAATVDYFYGVRSFYVAGSAFSPFLKLSYRRTLSARWAVTAFVRYESLGNAVAHSPIVSERDVVTAFAGLTFKIL